MEIGKKLALLLGLGNDRLVYADLFLGNWKKVKVPSHCRSIFFGFIFNCLETTSRHRFWNRDPDGNVPEKSRENFPCPFCEVGVDDYGHFFTDCAPIASAFAESLAVSGLEVKNIP